MWKKLNSVQTESSTGTASTIGAPHLHLAVGLQQLSDGHLVLLQPPLHQLGAADVDGALHVRRVVFGERPAVNHQQAARPPLDEARQALDVHGAFLGRTFLPCHVFRRWVAVIGLREGASCRGGLGEADEAGGKG